MNEPTFTPTPESAVSRKKKKKLNIPAIILFITTLVLLTTCIFLALNSIHLSKKTSGSSMIALEEKGEDILLEDMRSRLSSGDTVLSMLKDYYPDNIIYVDNGHYVFAEILSSLEKNHFEEGTFTKNTSGEMTYSENGTIVSHKGIDVSQFQGDIDFSKVKTAGIEYAIVRLGYRGYGSGTINDDPNFTDNIEGALQNDIQVGVYFFTQAISKQEAIEEADYVVDKIKPYKVTYPVVLDVEEIVGDDYRQQSLTTDQLTDVIIAFCDRVKEKGYTPMIYGNLKCLIGKVDLTRLEAYDKWFAYYDDELYYPYAISMWQYSDSGSIPGIDGSVDLNMGFKTWK